MLGEDRESAEILLIEDNDTVREHMAAALEKTGYSVTEAATGNAAFKVLRNQLYDLVLLDLKLPDLDGMDILRTIRRQDDDVPVIIVSSLQQLDTKVDGFDIGCDDYITKPFQVPELLGRVRRLLRRTERTLYGDPTSGPRRTVQSQVTQGPFVLDISSFKVYKDGKLLEMRKKLFDLLLFFVRNPDTVLSPEQLHQRVWDPREEMNKNSLYVHIHQLRSIIEEDPSHPQYLKTIRGIGFTFSLDAAKPPNGISQQ